MELTKAIKDLHRTDALAKEQTKYVSNTSHKRYCSKQLNKFQCVSQLPETRHFSKLCTYLAATDEKYGPLEHSGWTLIINTLISAITLECWKLTL